MKVKLLCMLFCLAMLPVLSSAATTRYVETYGANGGDLNDDTTAIQSALAALSSGDTLVFGNAGTNQIYLISGQLNLTKTNVNINFVNAAKLKIDSIGGTANTSVFFLNSLANGATFNDLYIDGNNKCKIGIYLYICNDVTLNDCIIENMSGNWDSQISVAQAIRVRTCANFTMNDGCVRNIINTGDDSIQEATGIFFANNDTAKCYNASVDGVEFSNIKAVNDADGIKFLTFGIDVASSVSDCRFYECYKRAVKVQTDNVQISGIYAENTSMDTSFAGSYLVDFQQSHGSSLTDSELHVAGRNVAGVGVSGEDLLIDNVDIYLTRKTNQSGAYQAWGIRKQGDDKDFMRNVTISNINIYGDFYNGIYLPYKANGQTNNNITIENIFSRKALNVNSALAPYITLTNSTFSSYSGVSGTNCLTASAKPVAHYKEYGLITRLPRNTPS